jgi:hypothetical protein
MIRLRRAGALLVTVLALGTGACTQDEDPGQGGGLQNRDDAGTPNRDDLQPNPPTTERPPSTGVPDGSTTETSAPGDGSTDDDAVAGSTVPGAEPGRPQLDAEPGPGPGS